MSSSVFKVKILRGIGLPQFGSDVTDAYVSVTFRGKTRKTSVKENNTNPEWNEELEFEMKGVLKAKDSIKFRVFDKEGMLSSDKFIGQASLDYRDFHGGKKHHHLMLKGKDGKSGEGKLAIVTDDGEKKDENEGGQKHKNAEDQEGDHDSSDDRQDDEGVDVSGGGGGGAIKTTTDRSKLSDKVEDFQIRVKIHEGRQLAGSNIKPVVKVKCGPNQIKITRVKKSSAPVWEEMMIFNFKESLKNLYDCIIELTVNNSKRLRSDALIGFFKLDLGNVYDQQGHAYVRKWILLTDPEDSSNTPRGYLKATICVLGAGDEPPSDSGGKEEDDDVEGNLLTPAGAALRSATFVLRVFKAEDVPQMDTAAFQSMKKFIGMGEEAQRTLVDPYAVFRFAGKKRKTKVIEQNNNPEWNEELALPLKFPSMCDTLQLTLYDWDRIGHDDAVGTFRIPISKISSTGEDSDSGFLPTFGPTFVNIYGSPREFSEFGDNLEGMNLGKCDGCAYRGRLMVELQTKVEEEGIENPPSSQPIEDDIVAATKKYLRRRKYRLIVAFQEASMIEKADQPIEFEVSMGNYGNKFDNETQASSSTTEPTQAIFEGTYYYYLPWASKKPVVCVTSHWEDIGFRYHSLNVLLRLISTMETDIARVKKMMADECDEIEIASEIVEILNELLLACTKGVPDPRGRTVANSLDSRLYGQRLQQLSLIRTEAVELRQTCTDAKLALVALEDYLERLKEMAYEPQSSMPDVIIWMLSDNKRIAYARIPANEVLYSKEREQYCGRMCGRMQNIFLKYPTARTKSKKNYKIACQLQAMVWLGRASDQDDFDFNSRGKISVYADTYETESKVPVKGWSADGFKDRTMEIPLPKDKFNCPPGWQWDEDWFISPSTNRLYDASSGFDVYTEEAYEVQYRFPGGSWEDEGMYDSNQDPIPNLNAIESQEGWVWQDEWEIDCNRACDEDGWEYTITTEEQNPVWQTMEKVFHLNRRRRWVRTKKCVDAKLQARKERELMALEEGWEYAKTSGSTFHPDSKTFDLVRRRRWMRRMVAEESRGSAAIFSLDRPLVHPDGPISEETSAMSPSGEELSPGPDESQMLSDPRPEEGAITSDDHKEYVEQASSSTTKKKKKIGLKRKKGKKESVASQPSAGKRGKSSIFSFGKAKSKKSKVPKMPTPRIFLNFEGAIKLQLRVYIYQARDLLPMDQDSFSDPFVYATFMSLCKRSELVRHTLNPIWDQTLIMDMDYYGDLNHLRSSCPDVILEVFDKDDIVPINFTGRRSRTNQVEDKRGHVNKGSLEFMGRATLQPMFKLDPEEPVSPRLAWFDIMRGNLAGGSVLATAELLVKSEDKMMPFLPPRRMEVFKVPPGIRPVLQRTALEFVIWGVRNMESFKLLSVDRPSVVIEIGDVEVRSKVIKNIKKFPNFSEPVFFLEANLPKEQIYCPPIVIRVKDNRKFGRRPTVGQHIISDLSTHVVAAPPIPKTDLHEDDEGFDDDPTVIEVIPPSPVDDGASKGLREELKRMGSVVGPHEVVEAPFESYRDDRVLVNNDELGDMGPSIVITDASGEPRLSISEHSEYNFQEIIEVYDPDQPGEDEMEESEEEEEEDTFAQGILASIEGFGKKIASAVPLISFEEEFREEEIDWWSKYYASIGDADKCGQYLSTGMDTIKVYRSELEKQEPYNRFSDFIQTFELFRGKQGKDDDDAPPVVGEFKGAIFMYPLPADPNDPMPERIFKNIPSTDPVEVKVRIYVVRAFDLAPQDSNGLADPYLKIKVGKKRILDRSNYLPNTLNPTFGRMFELDLILPMEKDLRVEVFDWDLIGTDDKVGETVIDLENRYLSKFKAWCGLPKSYCSSGTNKWRDQQTPKDWLMQKAKELGIDEPIWNGNTCVLFNKKKYLLETFEKNMSPCKDWGSADERLALHVLRTMPHVTEHVETRPLFTDVMPGIEQGRVQLWVDMFPKQYGEPDDPLDITPRKPSEYFIRVIVWNCREIPMMDTSMFGEKMTDIYVKGWIEGLEHKKQKTDVHYRSLDGTGMFNWRFVFPFEYLPQERVVVVSKKEHLWSMDKTTTKVPPVLNLQVWDNDLFGPNEYISEISLPLNKTPKCVKFNKFATIKNIPDLQGNCSVPVVNLFDQKMLNGWWPLYCMKDGERVQAGKIEMSVEVISREEHEERPAAKARDEPNENPKLEKPKRPATSFAWFTSPWKSFRYIIWKKYGCIIITILLVLLLIVFLALFIYTFPGSFTGWFLGKF
uniref:myoferlin-like isoform X2 n=1 Tax=Styela clava TaxID=7725 RepID=UPI00193A7CAD|nr:myoferlin-like isoform X2 [Styela clava]